LPQVRPAPSELKPAAVREVALFYDDQGNRKNLGLARMSISTRSVTRAFWRSLLWLAVEILALDTVLILVLTQVVRVTVIQPLQHIRDALGAMTGASADPIMNNDVGFFKLKGNPFTASDLKQVEGAKVHIGAVRGYALPKALAGANILFDPADNDDALVKKLLAGRDELILTDKAVGTYYANKQGADAAGKLQWLFSVESLPLRTGVVKSGKAGWQTVVKDYNHALAGLLKDGTVARELKEYGLR
jgi:hypothetical protein